MNAPLVKELTMGHVALLQILNHASYNLIFLFTSSELRKWVFLKTPESSNSHHSYSKPTMGFQEVPNGFRTPKLKCTDPWQTKLIANQIQPICVEPAQAQGLLLRQGLGQAAVCQEMLDDQTIIK